MHSLVSHPTNAARRCWTQIARKIVAHFQKTPPETADKKLSPMEGIVLTKLGRGRLYKEVADELQISISTVRTHVHSIDQKLHVHNRTEAIRKGLSLQPKRFSPLLRLEA